MIQKNKLFYYKINEVLNVYIYINDHKNVYNRMPEYDPTYKAMCQLMEDAKAGLYD